MQFFPAALQDLADHFARLPGIGGKTAQRLAFHVLELPMDDTAIALFFRYFDDFSYHKKPPCMFLTL